ncbi:MAG: class I SAM-dependent methyltransferase [Bryobacteraceae bacterium]
MAEVRVKLGQWVHAHLLEWWNSHYERLVADRKHHLLGDLSGEVMEIGAGTGPNLAFYPPGVSLTAVEPNPYMHHYLRRKADALGLPLEIQQHVAERIPAESDRFDAVVSTLVLCSVQQPAAVLAEIRRVLKPGGRFVFIEHVAADAGSSTRRRQEWIRPLCQCLADGCHPDRETWRMIDEAGFRHVSYSRFRLDLPVVGPHIAGYAVK